MGYYVHLRSAEFVIPRTDEVFQVLKDLNKRDDLKSGGAYGPGGKTESWFSWMPTDWDKTCTNAQEVFELLGFTVDPEADYFSLEFYDSKTGDEFEFVKAVAPYVRDGSYMEWIGEDYNEEVWVVRKGELHVLVRDREQWWDED